MPRRFVAGRKNSCADSHRKIRPFRLMTTSVVSANDALRKLVSGVAILLCISKSLAKFMARRGKAGRCRIFPEPDKRKGQGLENGNKSLCRPYSSVVRWIEQFCATRLFLSAIRHKFTPLLRISKTRQSATKLATFVQLRILPLS